MDKEKLKRFAEKHNVVLVEKGVIGFGRPCVGFVRGDGYIDLNPRVYPNLEPAYPGEYYLTPAEVRDAYHKHGCVAVLVHNDDYDEALRQLEIWVDDLESKGAYLERYATGAKGMQALLGGTHGYTFRFKE